eukprot:PLAT15345.1.p1 GENE.PLAT15345.1~~PLAT15345.1.p1  ORF type:complete len:383 (-),score=90.22 PLAT15345.1:69-1172(-)
MQAAELPNWQLLRVIYLTLCPLSLLGASAIITSFGRFAALRRNVYMTPVFWMAVCDACQVLKYLIPALTNRIGTEHAGSADCGVEYWLGQFFYPASFHWYFVISFNAWRTLRAAPITETALESERWMWHVYVWSMSAIGVAAPALGGGYEPIMDGTCWISGHRSPWRAFFFVPLAAYMLFAVALLYRAARVDALTDEFRSKMLSRMLAFVLCFVFLWSWAIIEGLSYLLIAYRFSLTYHYWLSALFASAGLVNACVWLRSYPIQRVLCSGKQRSVTEQLLPTSSLSVATGLLDADAREEDDDDAATGHAMHEGVASVDDGDSAAISFSVSGDADRAAAIRAASLAAFPASPSSYVARGEDASHSAAH